MTRVVCQMCGEPATYMQGAPNKYRGKRTGKKKQASADHDLCDRCYRGLLESRVQRFNLPMVGKNARSRGKGRG